MASETIEDIVREMRKGVLDWKGERVGVFDYFADRIEAASKSTVYTDNSETLHNALAENDRLRAALKPVLNVNIDAAIGHGVDCTELFGAIIKDAQRIYKEGATND